MGTKIDFTFWFEVLTKLGIPLYNQLRELFGPSIPSVEELKSRSNEIWAIIEEEKAKQ